MIQLSVYIPSSELVITLPAEIVGADTPAGAPASPFPAGTLSVLIPDEISAAATDLIQEYEIPLLSASKIGSGVLDIGRIPPIPADLIEWPSEEGGSTQSLTLPFGWGDASPKPIFVAQTGQTVLTVTLVIQIPFNGLSPYLLVGDDEEPDRLMGVSQNDAAFTAEYETNPGYSYLEPTELILTIEPGEGCTEGEGYLILEVI